MALEYHPRDMGTNDMEQGWRDGQRGREFAEEEKTDNGVRQRQDEG